MEQSKNKFVVASKKMPARSKQSQKPNPKPNPRPNPRKKNRVSLPHPPSPQNKNVEISSTSHQSRRKINSLSSRHAITNSHVKEHRVIEPDGRITADIVTTAQTNEHETTFTNIVEDVSEFTRTKIGPAFLGISSLDKSAVIQMIKNRFDIADIQNQLMFYCGNVGSLMTGPGFYLQEHGDRMKLNYSIFRGLNTFTKDFLMQKCYPSIRGPILYAGLTTEMKPKKINETDIALLKRHHQTIFKRHLPIWETSLINPMTIEELLMMTLCRYVARLRNMNMDEVDHEELNCKFPIINIDIDTVKEDDIEQTNHFGATYQIHDPYETPLNGIQSSLANLCNLNQSELHKKTVWSETQFNVNVAYDFSGITVPPQYGQIYRLNQDFAFKYATIKQMQRQGLYIDDMLTQLEQDVGFDPLLHPNLEHFFYSTIPNRGLIKSSLLLDIDAISAIKRYIGWCNMKYSKQQDVPRLESFIGNNVHEEVARIESGLVAARQKRMLVVNSNNKIKNLIRKPLVTMSHQN